MKDNIDFNQLCNSYTYFIFNYLRCDKNIFTFDNTFGYFCSNCVSNIFLVSVDECSVNVTISNVNSIFNRLFTFRLLCLHNHTQLLFLNTIVSILLINIPCLCQDLRQESNIRRLMERSVQISVSHLHSLL